MDSQTIFGAIYFLCFVALLVVAIVLTLVFGSRRNDRVEKFYNQLDEHDKSVINDWKEVNKLFTRDLRKSNNENK